MKQSEFLRWLRSQGVEVKEGAKHIKLYHQGNQTTLPRHPSHEIGEGLRKAVIKQLKLANPSSK